MMRETTALFAKDSEVNFLNAFKAARHGGGTDDFSVIVLTGHRNRTDYTSCTSTSGLSG
ncbi:MAG: hypothetical protein Q7S69_04740 [Nitrosomonadaceae bacterium]|nr:hypothetical protein [Nitrosomonadaceae bacterium]